MKFTFLVFVVVVVLVVSLFFYFIQPPSNLRSEIKLIKFIKFVNIFLIYYLLKGLVNTTVQQTLSTYVSGSVPQVGELVVRKQVT